MAVANCIILLLPTTLTMQTDHGLASNAKSVAVLLKTFRFVTIIFRGRLAHELSGGWAIRDKSTKIILYHFHVSIFFLIPMVELAPRPTSLWQASLQ